MGRKKAEIGNLEQEPPLFRRAIVAVALSPRIKAVLNQSQRILERIGARPILLHVGQDSPASRSRLAAAIADSTFAGRDPEVIIASGHPTEVMVEVARRQRADLILAGAAQKESLWRHLFGSVARQLTRQAPCSLLLMTNPQELPPVMVKLHCAVEYDSAARYTVEVAMGLAARLNSRELILTHSFRVQEWEGKSGSPPDAGEIRRVYGREDARLRRFLAKHSAPGIRVRAQCFYEHSLRSAMALCQDVNANLFIVAGPRHHEGLWDRLLKDNLEDLFQTLPGAILLTRKPRYRIR